MLPYSENVDSSDGVHKYTVTIHEDYTATCDCLGFFHRHYCRHVTEVLQRLLEKVSGDDDRQVRT